MQKISMTYREYLGELKKDGITKILDFYGITYKKNLTKEKLSNLIIDNLKDIVGSTLNIFQNDELINLKYIIKKDGVLNVKVNHLLIDFLNTLSDNFLVIKSSDNEFMMPIEVLDIYEEKINEKEVLDKIKINTNEYKLILGFVQTYGIIDFNIFYKNYSKIYKLSSEEALNRIKFYSNFFKEFKIFDEKKKHYLASNSLNNLKESKKYLKDLDEYRVYTNEEIMDIYTFKYMEGFKSYKKLIKFIKTNYNISKNNYKILNKYVFIPYLQYYQIDKNNAKEKLEVLINDYFEIKKEKQKNKLISLIENVAGDYPCWSLSGYSKKEHE